MAQEYYSAEEVDRMLAEAKAEMVADINKIIVLNWNREEVPEPSSCGTLWFKILDKQNA